MNPRVKAVVPEKNFLLRITFTNDEVKVFDVKPYLETGVFKELKNESLFNSVKTSLGSIHWIHGQDLCPDTLYQDGVSDGANYFFKALKKVKDRAPDREDDLL